MRREREQRRAREQQPRCGKVAGGTVAECTAVFCCFPFAVVELIVLAAIRVPAALCRPGTARNSVGVQRPCEGRDAGGGSDGSRRGGGRGGRAGNDEAAHPMANSNRHTV
uniref:Uncharacterized protein n=1 Tax=Oryza rufipogon TaxID=4529 RepID=A0A0E0PXP9_ORYRU